MSYTSHVSASGVRSRSNSNSSSHSHASESSSESSSSSEIPLYRIYAMKDLFNKNFDKFGGSKWILPSGAVVDDRLRGVVEDFSYESALHSFVVEDVDMVLSLFDDPRDREEITNTMVTRDGEKLVGLSAAELKFLERYNMEPKELQRFLSTHGHSSVSEGLEEPPSEEFQIAAHDSIAHLFRTYQCYGYRFPQEPTEVWYNHYLWGFLPSALSSYPLFDYRSGVITSQSSAYRRRKRRALDSRLQTGHTVDGAVVISKRSLELCWMEAGKKDLGAAITAKSLRGTRRLMKLLKDGHDMIREKAEQDIRHQLVTFGLRVCGPTITIYTLRQRPGRFYQAVKEDTKSLPLAWMDAGDTTQILAVVARILKLRKAIQAMATSITTWTQASIDDKDFGTKDWVAATVTSP